MSFIQAVLAHSLENILLVNFFRKQLFQSEYYFKSGNGYKILAVSKQKPVQDRNEFKRKTIVHHGLS